MVTLQPEVEDIIKKVAKKWDVSFTEAHQMYSSMFEVLYRTISSGNKETQEFPSMNIQGFGRFLVPEKVKKYWRTHNAKKQEEAINLKKEEV